MPTPVVVNDACLWPDASAWRRTSRPPAVILHNVQKVAPADRLLRQRSVVEARGLLAGKPEHVRRLRRRGVLQSARIRVYAGSTCTEVLQVLQGVQGGLASRSVRN